MANATQLAEKYLKNSLKSLARGIGLFEFFAFLSASIFIGVKLHGCQLVALFPNLHFFQLEQQLGSIIKGKYTTKIMKGYAFLFSWGWLG